MLAREAQVRALRPGSGAHPWSAGGRFVIAHIHPGHLASQGVARAAGLSPTGDVHNGEVRWAGSPAAAP